jgi:hypothetical protein
MAEKEILYEQKSSIELHRNAKGEYSWKIKVYDDSLRNCERRLLDSNIWMVGKYAKKDN